MPLGPPRCADVIICHHCGVSGRGAVRRCPSARTVHKAANVNRGAARPPVLILSPTKDESRAVGSRAFPRILRRAQDEGVPLRPPRCADVIVCHHCGVSPRGAVRRCAAARHAQKAANVNRGAVPPVLILSPTKDESRAVGSRAFSRILRRAQDEGVPLGPPQCANVIICHHRDTPPRGCRQMLTGGRSEGRRAGAVGRNPNPGYGAPN